MSIREEARKKATQIYLKRLNDLNVDAETKTVLDSIDRPMRPLILELHRIGMTTTFCCCGFTYEGEEEPKTHHAKFTYVFIKKDVKTELGLDNANKFLNQIVRTVDSKWSWQVNYNRIKTCKGEPLIHLFYQNPIPDIYQQDGMIPAIHDFEAQSLAIKHAIDVARSLPTVDVNICIHDGNADYFEAGVSEWQLEPKPDYVHNIIKNVEIVNE